MGEPKLIDDGKSLGLATEWIEIELALSLLSLMLSRSCDRVD